MANPKNVRFHPSSADAEAAGFRPCKRCKPDQPSIDAQNVKTVARICRLIEQAEEKPSLARLAAAAGLSPYYFHRLFKAVTGVTPKDYATAHRAGKVRDELGRSGTVTEAIYGAGFNSNGRFYEKSDEILGMTPTAWRAGGANATVRFAVGECSLGALLMASSSKGVCAILLGDDPEALLRDLQDRFPRARLIGGDGDFEKLVAQVVGLIEAPGIGLDLPLDLRGTAFQQRVWAALGEIPPGTTATYSDIAKQIGSPKAVRAVAGACAANALAVAIPCHRVVRTDGTLSGYRWGVERKRTLIDREAEAAGTLAAADSLIGRRRSPCHLLDLNPTQEPCMSAATYVRDANRRVETLDWSAVSANLDAQGWAIMPKLLSTDECDEIAGLYDRDIAFRSQVVMARHGFGRGEYKYFAYPLPPLVEGLRTALYPRLAPIANRWYERLGMDVRFPADHAVFIARCHAAGQNRPTPLLLRYGAGDYNCLHQDLYGEHVFPLQVATLLSEPGEDFEGGEFVLAEQRPRMQSRATVVPLTQSDAVIFAVNSRPVRGTRGDYRVSLRHGVSQLRSGHRHTLGIIFHDAA